MNGFRPVAVLAAATSLLFAGCGKKKDEHGHAHGSEHDHAEAPAAVAFKKGHGLQFTPESAKALGLATADVVERSIAHRIELRVSVLTEGPPARAMALVSAEIANDLENHPAPEARVVSVNRAFTAATGLVDVTFAIPRPARGGESLPLVLNGAPKKVTAVPKSAVLQTATGTFVFVANGESLLRTAVKIGATDGSFVEITDGLYSGDVVAVTAVEQLWLTELRLTKGGGHGH